MSCETQLKYMIEETQKQAANALDLYEDRDLLRQQECERIAGLDPNRPEGTVWNAFYERIKEVAAG